MNARTKHNLKSLGLLLFSIFFSLFGFFVIVTLVVSAVDLVFCYVVWLDSFLSGIL